MLHDNMQQINDTLPLCILELILAKQASSIPQRCDKQGDNGFVSKQGDTLNTFFSCIDTHKGHLSAKPTN